MTKIHKKTLDEIGLQYLSLTSRITPIAILVLELLKSQDDTVVLSRTWTSFGCLLFGTNITIELGKVFYSKDLDKLLSFLTV